LPVLLVSPSKFALENCYVYCPPQHFDEIFAPGSTYLQLHIMVVLGKA